MTGRHCRSKRSRPRLNAFLIVSSLKGSRTSHSGTSSTDSLRADGSKEGRDELETARLTARVRVFPFSDKQVGEAVDLCSQVVASGSLSDAEDLWNALLTIASDSRGTGAHFDLPGLLKLLRPRLELRDYPDYEADWKKLETISKENLANETRNSLGEGIHLPRNEARKLLVEEFERNSITVVSGESGSGKSALVAEVVAPGAAFRRTVWLTSEQLSKASQVELAKSLGLRHMVPDLLSGSAVACPNRITRSNERWSWRKSRRGCWRNGKGRIPLKS